MGRLWILAVLAFTVFPQRGLALVGSNLAIEEKLEDTIGRPLTASERISLEHQREIVEDLSVQALYIVGQSASRTTVLYCASGDVDLYLSFSISGCVDSALNSYFVIATGTGITVGISTTLYTLVYRSYDGSKVSGKYYGGTVSGAWGTHGATVGMFYPFESSPNRLYLIGYVVGASVDFSGVILTISRLDSCPSSIQQSKYADICAVNDLAVSDWDA